MLYAGLCHCLIFWASLIYTRAVKLSNFDLPAICCPKLESSPLSRREGRKKKRSPCQSSSPSPSCSLLRKEMGRRGGLLSNFGQQIAGDQN